jgi:hypothetical protein
MPSGTLSYTAADDSFHDIPGYDPTWIESSWFGYEIPERRISGNIYVCARPSLGVALVDVTCWRDVADQPWDADVRLQDYYVRLPEDADMRDLRLSNGVSDVHIKCLEPTMRYQAEFHNRDADIELTFDGVMEPHSVSKVPSVDIWTGAPGTGRIDQPGRITGRYRVFNEEFEINCIGQHDRSWGPRREMMDFRISFIYGNSEEQCFFAFVPPADAKQPPSGYILRDGKVAPLVRGSRRASFAEIWPSTVSVELEDELGRTVVAEGRCTNRYPVMFPNWNVVWVRQVHWTLDDGSEIWGEDQECTHLELDRAARRRVNPPLT